MHREGVTPADTTAFLGHTQDRAVPAQRARTVLDVQPIGAPPSFRTRFAQWPPRDYPCTPHSGPAEEVLGTFRPMSSQWPSLPYELWSATADTLHGHTQVLGKLAAALAPPEPQLQHAALRLTARGWETLPLPAPDGSGVLVVTLDLRSHEAVAEHSDGRRRHVPLVPHRSVGDVTGDVLAAVAELGGAVRINPTPQEVPWTTPLDRDDEHATYEPDHVETYFAAATRAALVLAALRAPYRGRSTPVNAWWGSFDLAVNLFSGLPADPPSSDFIMRNGMDAQDVAVGWWPGDARYPRAAFYSYAHPAPADFGAAQLSPPAARWEASLGEYVLDWDDVRASAEPHATALDFARSAVRHACLVCGWDPALTASVEGPPFPLV
jgi:Family of unknown function (DUF5996)